MAAPSPHALVSRAAGTLGEARRLAKQVSAGGPEAALALVKVADAYVHLAATAHNLGVEPTGADDGDDEG